MNYLEYKKLNNSNKDVINSSLIKCYRERESLWNVKLKNCNINKQYEYYQEISNLTGIDGYYLCIYYLNNIYIYIYIYKLY